MITFTRIVIMIEIKKMITSLLLFCAYNDIFVLLARKYDITQRNKFDW